MKTSRALCSAGWLLPAAVLFSTLGCMRGPAHEGSFSRDLSVSGPTILEVENAAGGVRIAGGSAGKVSIHARIHARGMFVGMSGAEKVRRIEDNPPIVQQGNTVRIGRISDPMVRKNVFIDYEITLPADAQITITNGAGNVSLRETRGSLRATTGAGNVIAEGVTGDSYLNTGAGNVEIRRASGRLEANSGAGSIRASGSPKKDWRLSVGAGSIHVEVPSDASFELDAQTGFGKVNLSPDFDLKSASIGSSRVQGTVGKGGPMLRVNNGAGSIDIRHGGGETY
jgi:putative adhesin